VAACGSSTHTPVSTVGFEQIPAEPQRAGDPAKGYDYLINGGYITCGIPQSLYERVFGPPAAADKLSGRTGENANLPYYYSAAMSSEGIPVVSANCLTCHGSKVNGKLVVGLGAAAGDFTSDPSTDVDAAGNLITDPTEKAEWQRFDDRMHAIAGYTQTKTIGVNPADNLTASLMAHRDPTTLAWSDTPLLDLPPDLVVPVDVPPWWRMAKKNAMFYSSAGRGDHARIEMAASLLCTDSVAEATAIDAAFVDVRAWIETLTPPAWPFAVDTDLASRGESVFVENCAMCHGTYGAGGSYPNLLVPIDVVGTDATLATGASQFADRYVQWFASSFWGQTSRLEPKQGYVAPPLDGIWATAPFFHNGSVPTIEGVLDSSKRPQYWTRNYDDSTDYDQTNVGWNFQPITHGQVDGSSPTANAQIYDTDQVGYSNTGHTFGDFLSDDDRRAVIEYLKTL
jgi:mono/diheme cytochrome c family protein